MIRKSTFPPHDGGGHQAGLIDKTISRFDGGNYSPVLNGRRLIGNKNNQPGGAMGFRLPSKKTRIMTSPFLTVAKNSKIEMILEGSKVYQNEPCCSNMGSGKAKNTNEFKINIFCRRGYIVVGTKFVNFFSGKFLFQISNTQGQTVFSEVF
jgi:hypothetical protein